MNVRNTSIELSPARIECKNIAKQNGRLTQHKRFALRAHPNSAFGGTSFMLIPLIEIAIQRIVIKVIL